MQLAPPRLRVNVEYCKSCETHTWCTHHQEEKYFNTFKKLKQYLEDQFQSQVIVQGNVVPDDFVPIKPAENKYYSQKTNKYVQFPVIGAFQITIEGEVVFSKKKTNTWPNLTDIGDKVHFQLYASQRPRQSKDSKKSPSKQKKSLSPKKQQRLHSAEGDIRTQKDNRSQNNQSFMDNNDKRSTFYKPKSNYKNFTLTDHFKNYHNQDYKHPINSSNRDQEEFFTNNQTDNDQQNFSSELGSFRQRENSEKQFLDFKRNFDNWTHTQSKTKLSQLLKRKGHMKDDGVGGKKEMIIRLDSIEEESILIDENGLGSTHQGQNNLAPPGYFNNTHSTFKSRKENTHKEIMKQFNDDFDELEEKFKNFEQRVENIREENKKFDYNQNKKHLNRQSMPKIMNEKTFKEIKQGNKKEKRLKSSDVKEFKQDESFDEQDMLNNPIIFAKRKLKNIEDYINGTQEEKNEKLKKIYGEWKLFRKPYKGKNYISPYKMELLSRIGTGQTNQKNNRKKIDSQYKDQESQDDSSLLSSDVKQVQQKKNKFALHKSKISKMPPMPPGKPLKGQQNMTQQFYHTSQDNIQQTGAKKLQKKSSQLNTKSFEQLRQTQNQFHRAGAGIKINTVDRLSQMKQKNQEGWADKSNKFANSFNHSKQKAIKNGRILRSIDKISGQDKISSKKNSTKLRLMNKSQKNLNQIGNKESQPKLERKYQSKKQNDQFLGSGHSNDSEKLFKNFRTKKNQNISKSKEKLSTQNQNKIQKKGRQVYLNRQQPEDMPHQQSYNNSQSLQNNYLQKSPSKKSKHQNKSLEKDQRVKKGYEKGIGQNKEWRESRIGSKQKKLSYQHEGQKSKSKHKVKQSQSLWKNPGEVSQQQSRKSLTQEDHEQENETSTFLTSKNKLQKMSIHKRQKNIEKQKSKRIQTDGDEISEKEIVGKRKNRTYVKGEKPRNKKKRETIIEIKDLDKSGLNQRLRLQNQQGSDDQESSNQEIKRESQIESENEEEKNEAKTLKNGQSKHLTKEIKNKSQINDKIKRKEKQSLSKGKNDQDKKQSPQINKKTSKQKNDQNKKNKDQNQEEEDSINLTSSKYVNQAGNLDESSGIGVKQKNKKSVHKDGKKLKKTQKQEINKNSSQLKNSHVQKSENDNNDDGSQEAQKLQNSKDLNEDMRKSKGNKVSTEKGKSKKASNKNIKKNKKSALNQNGLSQEKEGEQQSESQESSENFNQTSQINEDNRNFSQSENQTSKLISNKKQKKNKEKQKKLQKKNKEKREENVGQDHDSQQENVEQQNQQDDLSENAEETVIKKGKSSKKNKKHRDNKGEQNQLQEGQQEVFDDQDNESNGANQQNQEQGSANDKAMRSKERLKKKEKRQKNEKNNKNKIQSQQNDSNTEIDQSHKDQIENENENENDGQENSQAPEIQQKQGKTDDKTKEKQLKFKKNHSKAIKQETSRLMGVQGQTQRLNTARSVLSRNQIIGIYNDKDSDDNEDSQILDNDNGQQNIEQNNMKKSQKKSSKKNGKRKEQSNNQQEPLSEINQNLDYEKYQIDNVGHEEKKKSSKSEQIQLEDSQQKIKPQYCDVGIQIESSTPKKSGKVQQNPQGNNTQDKNQLFLQPACLQKREKSQSYQQNSQSYKDNMESNASILAGQGKKWPEKSLIRNLNIQRSQSPQLEISKEEREIEKDQQKRKGNVFDNEKNQVDDMDQELDEDGQQQNVLTQIKDSLENFKNLRAPIIKQFYGESFKDQIKLYPSVTQKPTPLKNFTSLSNLNQTIPQNSIVSQLPINLISPNPRLFNTKSIEIEKLTSNHPLPNLIKCLKILADINEFLIIRLFENPSMKITKKNALNKTFGVWLCVNYEWICVIIDLNQILLSSESQREDLRPFYLQHSSNLFLMKDNQLWPIVLEAALAKALKSYKFLANLPCHKLFNILTGSNSLFFNIKQDPSKNGRILRYITDCENKNFILHAEKVCKNLEELERSEKQTKIYYVLSQKIVNGNFLLTAENEILLQIRESIRPDSQWMKLTKFVQEFKSIEILQLRLNHNFSSIKLPKPMNTSNLTIIELDYLEESFGSITLSTSTGEICPLLKTYLYKQEKSNVLKLVGEAKEKNKSTLFFDCFFGETRYYLFVESSVQSRVTYLGENQPLIKIVEEINSDGLKNDYTQYLPIRSMNQNTLKTGSREFSQMSFGAKMPNKLSKSRFGETGMSFKSQQDEKISRLRENFVEYLLKGKD